MSVVQHTPGPWKANKPQYGDGYWWVFGGSFAAGKNASPTAATPCVAHVDWHCYGGVEEVAANARLIAAAPDLLSAMELLLRLDPTKEHEADNDYLKARDAAVAIVNKARGV